MSPRDDDKFRFMSAGWPSPGQVRIAQRMQELEAREGIERVQQLSKYSIESPWPIERWLDAYDELRALHEPEAVWLMIEESHKLGQGPNLAVVMGQIMRADERRPAKVEYQVSWIQIAVLLLGFALAVGFCYALVEAMFR